MVNRFSRVSTIDLRTDFLQPGQGSWFEASAQIMRLGGRVGSCRMELRNDANVLIATANAAYILT
jgi:acyl-coenzyme A thioesterase PaaI-like protein